MIRTIFKFLPLALTLYAVGMFASATTIAQLSSASGKKDGIWIQLCATGSLIFLDLSGDNDKTPLPSEMPGKTHAQACHACGDDRRLFKLDDSGKTDEV